METSQTKEAQQSGPKVNWNTEPHCHPERWPNVLGAEGAVWGACDFAVQLPEFLHCG